mmetsp:Transcript_45699/g.54984  ORF Transcript_45699/g.54984 Transcript_45699/m.54984 type:complete len:172 (+) Transcript_45699:24-539(+)
MASTDCIIKSFPHPTITPIVGQPCFETITPLKLLLSTNATSVTIHLENSQLSLMCLTISDTFYNTLSLIPFVSPISPGPLPIIPPGSTQLQITAIMDTHKHAASIFKEFNNTNKAFKQQLLGVVDNMFTRTLKNGYIGYANISTMEFLVHLVTSYGNININSGDLRKTTSR